MSAEGLPLKHHEVGIENGSMIHNSKWHNNNSFHYQQCDCHCIRHRTASLLCMHYTEWSFAQTSVNYCNDDDDSSNTLTNINTVRVVGNMFLWSLGMNTMTIQQCFNPISTCVLFQNNVKTALLKPMLHRPNW